MSNYLTDRAAEVARAMRPRQIKINKREGAYSMVPYQTRHNTGGAIMGSDPKSSAVNRYLQSWDVPNVFVMGACARGKSVLDADKSARRFFAALCLAPPGLIQPQPAAIIRRREVFGGGREDKGASDTVHCRDDTSLRDASRTYIFGFDEHEGWNLARRSNTGRHRTRIFKW